MPKAKLWAKIQCWPNSILYGPWDLMWDFIGSGSSTTAPGTTSTPRDCNGGWNHICRPQVYLLPYLKMIPWPPSFVGQHWISLVQTLHFGSSFKLPQLPLNAQINVPILEKFLMFRCFLFSFDLLRVIGEHSVCKTSRGRQTVVEKNDKTCLVL